MEPTRLTKIGNIPNFSVLQSVNEMASMIRSAVISLPFQRDGDRPYSLTCTFAFAQANQPRWSLFNGDKLDVQPIWSHDSSDLSEVEYNLNLSVNHLAQAGAAAPMALSPFPSPADAASASSSASAPLSTAIVQAAREMTLPEPAVFDQAKFDRFYAQMLNKQSGLFAEGSFYWFLMQEFYRYQRTNSHFSIAMISAVGSTTTSKSREEIDAWFGGIIAREVRKLDFGCHFEGMVAIVLTGTTLPEAVNCAQRLIDVIVARNNEQRFEAALSPHAGVACMPLTCEHPGILIAAAQKAHAQSVAANVTVTAFS